MSEPRKSEELELLKTQARQYAMRVLLTAWAAHDSEDTPDQGTRERLLLLRGQVAFDVETIPDDTARNFWRAVFTRALEIVDRG